jgi:hypothetical protein
MVVRDCKIEDVFLHGSILVGQVVQLANWERLKGTVSPVLNQLNVLTLDRPWLRHQALTIN